MCDPTHHLPSNTIQEALLILTWMSLQVSYSTVQPRGDHKESMLRQVNSFER